MLYSLHIAQQENAVIQNMQCLHILDIQICKVCQNLEIFEKYSERSKTYRYIKMSNLKICIFVAYFGSYTKLNICEILWILVICTKYAKVSHCVYGLFLVVVGTKDVLSICHTQKHNKKRLLYKIYNVCIFWISKYAKYVKI